MDAAADRSTTGTAAGTTTGTQPGTEPETFNPWSVVNLVFHHLAEHGLHPVLGGTGDPGRPAAELLAALGIQPEAEGNRAVREGIREHLGTLRTTILGER